MNALIPASQTKNLDMTFINHLCDVAMKSKCYQSLNRDQILHLYITAHDLGIPYSKALNNGFNIIQGNLCMKPSLMNDMIRKAGHSLKIKFGYGNDGIVKNCSILGTRKDNGDTLEIMFSWLQAERASLTKKQTWKDYPEDMLFASAMRRIGRMLFADVIGNSYTPDELEEIIDNPKYFNNKLPSNGEFFDKSTIDVENTIPKLEQKPEIQPISIESLHLSMDVIGHHANIEDVKDFISYTSSMQTTEFKVITDQMIINQAMSDEKMIKRFSESFIKWITSQTEKISQ